MGKMNVGRMAADFQTTSNVQRKKDQKDTTEDFKKLLKDKPEGEQEVPKDTDTVKEEKVPVQKTEKPEINETLAALQMAYALRGGSIPVQQEETAEATADVDVLNIAPESVIPVNTMPQDEEVQAADGRVDVQEGQTEAVQGRSTEGMQEKVQSVQTADSVHTEAAPKAEKKAKPENIVKKDETVSTGVNAGKIRHHRFRHTQRRENMFHRYPRTRCIQSGYTLRSRKRFHRRFRRNCWRKLRTA